VLPDKQSEDAIMQTQSEIVEEDGKDLGGGGAYLLPECSSPSGTRSKRDDCHYKFNAVNEKMARMALASPKDNA
jgi:hypothetical protein